MRNLHLLDEFRDTSAAVVRVFGNTGDQNNGVFHIPSPIDRAPMTVIASTGEGWEHISASRANRCPNWPEMEFIKRLFFMNHECAMQLHPPIKDYVDGSVLGGRALNTLHIWRPMNVPIPRPPTWMVGPHTGGESRITCADGGNDARTEDTGMRDDGGAAAVDHENRALSAPTHAAGSGPGDPVAGGTSVADGVEGD